MSLEPFAGIAAEFCGWVEAIPGEPLQELESARRLAARLYAAALDLPGGGPTAPDRAYDEPVRQAVFERFAALPINLYAVVDPLTVPPTEPGVGDLADDLTDTYFDILRGLGLHRAGHQAAAASEWSWSFRTHWGDHVVSALSALQAFATRA